MTYIIVQRAITGKFVPDGGEHVEYDDLGVAVGLAEDRTEGDGFARKVLEFASGSVAWCPHRHQVTPEGRYTEWKCLDCGAEGDVELQTEREAAR